MRFVILSVLSLACYPALAEEPAGFRVETHLMGKAVGFDGQGRCSVTRGRAYKSWKVPGFPAKVPHFESCTTIRSSLSDDEVDFSLAIVSPKGEQLRAVDGVLALGSAGQASQAIDWDDLEIPAAGTYRMVLKVDGKVIARFPMQFSAKQKTPKK
ncbi:MAG: hypothetical protein JXR96_29085 [Deltaproteobacteria bacterium]|nr:hypothetical protein [Deltaproteobacteria bacterium]